MAGTEIELSCYWLAQLPEHQVRPLASPEETDVVVIGAGLTGLWTALFLKELDPSREVTVVEQGIAAWGASGRNAGMLAETLDHTHGLAIQHFGAAEAARLAALGEANVRELTTFIRDRDLRCDYEPTGRFMAAFTEGHLVEARRNLEIARSLGIDSHRLLSREEMQAQVHSPRYLGGLEVRGGGILDPARFTDGLRREAERLGVKVHERTRVERILEDGAGVRLLANGTTLKARRAVLGTSAYTHHLLPRVRHRFIPLYDYILVSEPLTPAQWESIGWKGRQGITDGRTFFNYYRPTADGRVLWGTSEATYYRGNRVDPSCDHSPGHEAALRESWRRTFPPAGRPAVALRLGRTHLLHHAAHAVLRQGPGRPRLVRARLHRPRPRQHAAGRAHPGPPGAGPPQRAALAGAGDEAAVPLPARAAARLGGRLGDPRAAQGGRRGGARPDAPPAGADGDRVLELSQPSVATATPLASTSTTPARPARLSASPKASQPTSAAVSGSR